MRYPPSAALPDRPATRNLSALRRLLHFIQPYRWILTAAFITLIIAAGSVLTFGQVLRTLVDSGLASGSIAELNHALLFFFSIVIITAIAITLRAYLLDWIGERVVADIRSAVFTRVLQLDLIYFERIRTGELISRLTSDTALLQIVVGSTLAMAVRSALLMLGGIIMLAITSPALTALVLLGVPIVIAPGWWLGSRVRRLARGSQDRIADIGAYVDETIHGIRTVQAFNHETIDSQHYGERLEAAFSIARERAWNSALLSGVATLMTFGAIGLVIWVGGHQVLTGELSGGQLSAFLFYAVLVASSVGSLSDLSGQLLRGAGASERLMELLEMQPRITAPPVPISLAPPVRGCIECEQMSFYYPSRPETPALDQVHFTIAPGERVALVGPSGSGKSTLFQLLLRFYDPSSGFIRFDGIDLRALDPKELRTHIALVPQEPVIFATSAWENIRYGLNTATDAQIRQAATVAHAIEFIEKLPQGFNTDLGERGIRLSGGERQRIAIARTILRNPRLLLLDEATSALDAASEQFVQAALEQLMRDRTTIVIAHRLATVRHADRILVLEHGRIVATGDHTSLMRDGGLYAKLAALQFQTTDQVI
ncbi:ATP-binding cassette domain-containing protein [Rhodoferax sp. 4810]|uniref:ATP-binding cassette domain-containing protein n=1 Tax=Thiospirillum jenense TaxID=1653858 RepID=A0A839HGN2_9GAMM|nr:ABC transporter transmembrane domain-containing protein [Thiospirillum jenense]MBB1074704.1 ATP-binding cassette domain-containing protein [Rhodoferax jenense]MBB1125452.1 ATP-binding cassette domain-containing protein [Thiospirillum jenense]